MRIEEIARRSAKAACDSAGGVDVTKRLELLEQELRTRRRTSVMAGVLAAALVVGGGVWTVRAAIDPNRVSGGVDVGSGFDEPHDGPPLQAGSVGLDVPLRHPASTVFIDGELTRYGTSAVEFHRRDASGGLVVFENAVPVTNGPSWQPDPSAGHTALDYAHWLARRPFLEATTVSEVTVDARPAWRVTGQLTPHAILTARDGRYAIAPVLDSGRATAKYARQFTGEFTFLDVPDAGVVAVWSWAKRTDAANSDVVRDFVARLRFG